MNRKFDLLKILAIIASTLTAILLTIQDHYSSSRDMTSGDDLLHPKALCRPPATAWELFPYSYNVVNGSFLPDHAADVRGQDDDR